MLVRRSLRLRERLLAPCCLVALIAAAGPFSGVCADEAVAQPAAITTADPGIPVDHLELLLLPLTKEELVVEADAWMGLLKEKQLEISRERIRVKKANAEMAQAEEEAEAVEEKAEEAKEKAEEAKEQAEEAKESSGAATDEAASTEPSTGADDAAVRAAEEQAKAAEAEAQKAAAEASAEAERKAEEKKALLDRIPQLEAERTEIIDRLNAVLRALKDKGGEVDAYKLYIAEVQGLQIDWYDPDAIWAALKGWSLNEQGGLRWAKNLASFVGIVFVFLLLSRAVGKGVGRALSATRRLSSLLRDFLVKAIRRVILAVGVVVGLSSLEVDIGPLLAVIGAAGFVVAFALQGTLSNFASGILILFYRPFDVGDVIDVSGVVGKVVAMNLVTTQINTGDNKVLYLPNNTVWGNIITNITGSTTRRVDMVFGIGYSDDIDKAQTVLESIVKGHEKVLADPEPVIQVNELGESSVNFIVRPWSRTEDYWTVYWDVTREVKRRFDAEGISIPFPQRDVHVFQEGGSQG